MVNSTIGEFIPAVISDFSSGAGSYRDENKAARPKGQDSSEPVSVSISQTARDFVSQIGGETFPATPVETESSFKNPKDKNPHDSSAGSSKDKNGQPVSSEEREMVKELQKRDSEVRAHEMQHLAAAGPYAVGGIKYEYETGPDGRQYAVGGSVDMDTSAIENNPEATIQKAQTLRRAALATSDPSSADKAVASSASEMEMRARAEISQKGERKGGGSFMTSARFSGGDLLEAYTPRLLISKGHIIDINA